MSRGGRELIAPAEDISTSEVAEWAYRALDWAVQHDEERLTGRRCDERAVETVQALEYAGDGVGYFEVETSDGSIFTVHVGRKGV